MKSELGHNLLMNFSTSLLNMRECMRENDMHVGLNKNQRLGHGVKTTTEVNHTIGPILLPLKLVAKHRFHWEQNPGLCIINLSVEINSYYLPGENE